MNKQLSESELLNYHFALKQLRSNKPIQYVLGETEFYGLPFKVSEQVLIPRQETEELVDLIIKESEKEDSLIDVGCGSGCISVSYKKERPQSDVVCIDIDPEALEVAKTNARLNLVKVRPIQMDILNWTDLETRFDIVVSNPPYVTLGEKANMNKNVLNFEPHVALFVEDVNPVVFYESIAAFALAHLKENGRIYFEINERFGREVASCLEVRNFKDIRIMKDINGKDRIVAGHL
jgi:release factor glutamine methyltransferase